MAALRAWVRGLDPPIYLLALSPPIIGAAATRQTDAPLGPQAAVAATAAFVALHAAVNIYNDAFDAATRADRVKRHSLALLTAPARLHTAATVLLVAAVATGIMLWSRVWGWHVPALGAAGVALMFAYHAPPLRLSYRGWGEIVTFVGFGTVPTWATAALGDGMVPRAALWPGVAVGLAAALVLWHHNVASIGTDRAGGKRTIASRIGMRWGGIVGAGAALVLAFTIGWLGAWEVSAVAAAGVVVAAAAWHWVRPKWRGPSLLLYVAGAVGVLVGSV